MADKPDAAKPADEEKKPADPTQDQAAADKKKKLSLDVTEVDEVLERKISP